MTDADRTRLAAEYAICPAAIPNATIIPTGIMVDQLLTPQQRITAYYRKMKLARALALADRKSGRVMPTKDIYAPEHQVAW